MYIEIDGQDYELRSSSEAGISIDFKNPDFPIIYAHPQETLDQVKTFIRQFRSSGKIRKETPPVSLEFLRIPLFDSSVSVKVNRSPKFSIFWKDDIAICDCPANTDLSSPAFRKRISEALFEQFIAKRVSYWEEELGLLTGELSFRKMKTRHFRIEKDSRDLQINKNNQQYSRRTNDYILCKALLEQYHQPEKLGNYFPDQPQIERMLNYG